VSSNSLKNNADNIKKPDDSPPTSNLKSDENIKIIECNVNLGNNKTDLDGFFFFFFLFGFFIYIYIIYNFN
jgi:hypothetical protein